MFRTRSPIFDRLLQFFAWFIFGFCSVVIVTGMIVGQTSASHAEEQVAEQVAGEDAGMMADTGSAAGEESPEAPLIENERAENEPAQNQPSPEAAAEPVAEAGAEAGAEEAVEGAENEAITLRRVDRDPDSSPLGKAISFLGIFALLGVALLMSTNRRRVNWKLVSVGVGLQLGFALLIFYVSGGRAVFEFATIAVKKLLDFTAAGSDFIFSSFVTGQWDVALINFSFAVLPTIIFFSALMTIMYHLGIMQRLVHMFAWVMQKTMNISGAESMSAAANIFVGQTEAPLVVKPYVNKMTMSELMVVMTGGFATVAGGVLAIYVGMLESSFPDIAGHLLAASVMSAPAALVIAKIMYPETESPETMGQLEMETTKEDINVLDAASRGAAEGLKLALNVAAMLLAFIALIALINYLIGLPSLIYNKRLLANLAEFYGANGLAIPDACVIGAVADDAVHGCVTTMQGAAGAAQSWVAPMVTMQDIFGIIFWPFAWVMGVPASDCYHIAQLLGEKMVINELVAYASLQGMLHNPEIVLSDRSVIIATYALCGFANFGSIGIQLGGIGGIAPDRKQDLAKIALKAMIGGTLAAFMTATIAGILI